MTKAKNKIILVLSLLLCVVLLSAVFVFTKPANDNNLKAETKYTEGSGLYQYDEEGNLKRTVTANSYFTYYGATGIQVKSTYKTYDGEVFLGSDFKLTGYKSFNQMFVDCTGLTSVTFDGIDTSLITNMSYMFTGCTGLNNITFTNIDTSKVVSMALMFNKCSNLSSLDLSAFNTESVVNMNGMFMDCSALTQINVSSFNTSNVTNMTYMFYNCKSLTGLDLNNFDTSNVTSFSNMFSNCGELKSLNIDNFKTSKCTNMFAMFKDCSQLTSINLSNFDTSNVTSMYGMFNYCKNLTELDLSSFDTTNVTNFTQMLDYCDNLNVIHSPKINSLAINLPTTETDATWCDVNTSDNNITQIPTTNGESHRLVLFAPSEFPSDWKKQITSTDYMIEVVYFAQITSIKFEHSAPTGYTQIGTLSTGIEVYASDYDIAFVWGGIIYAPQDSSQLFLNGIFEDISFNNFDTSKVTIMRDMFCGCSNITSLDLSNFKTTNVTNMRGMFLQCNNITEFIFGDGTNFDTSNVTTMHQMFRECTALTELDLSMFNTDSVESVQQFLYDSKNITSINLSSFNTSNMTDISYMFYGCRSLSSLDIKHFDTSNVTTMQFLFCYCESLPSIDVSNFDTRNVKEMNHMFSGCKKITALDLTNFDTKKVIYMSNMFSSCYNLVDLNIKSFDTSYVIAMDEMFRYCISLTSLDLTHFDTSKVQYMTYMFCNDRQLKSVNVSSFDTSRVTDMSLMFGDCGALESIDLSNFNTERVTNMSNMFSSDASLKNLDVSNFITTNVKDMGSMFYGCSGLTSLDLSNFSTSNVTNMSRMFSKCEALTDIIFGDSFDTSNLTNMSYMFYNCSNLVNLDMSNFDTSKVTSYTDLFNNCAKLKNIKTPKINTLSINLPTLKSGFYWYDETANTNDLKTFPTTTGESHTIIRKAPTYVITYNANGGNGDDVTQEVEYDETFTTKDETTFTKKGYRLVGWSTSQDKQTGNYGSPNTKYNFGEANNITLYAIWEIQPVELPSDWKGEINNSNYMTTPFYFTYISSIIFDYSAPADYSKIGTFSTGIEVYAKGYNVAFVWYSTILAPQDSYNLFCNVKSTTIAFNNFDTSNVVNMYGMFQGCINLTNLDLSCFNTSKVTNMYAMFESCEVLSSITFGSEFTANIVTNMSGMFKSCSKLTELDFSLFDVNEVTNMESMFDSCRNLKVLDLSNFNTSNVTNMNNMFTGCSNLTIINLSSFNTSKVTNMSAMFSNCSKLTELDLSNFDTSNVTNMGRMFVSCTRLTSINISGFNTEKVTDLNGMFWNCSALQTLDLSSFNTISATNFDYLLYNCFNLRTLKSPKINSLSISLPTLGNGYYWYDETAGESELTTIPTTNGESHTIVKKAASYVITYNANGGSGDDVRQDVTYYEEFTTKPSDLFVRDGYFIKGWCPVQTELSGMYQPDTTYTYTDYNDITLYAIWSPITYTINYDGNGATSGSTESSIHTYDKEGNLTANGFIKTGFNFIGWSTTSDGQVQYQDKASVVNLTTENEFVITLYAIWEAKTDVSYVVEHYLQNLDGATYELSESQTLQGTTNTLTNAVAKTDEGFVSQQFNQVLINGDGSTIVKIYYDRNIYTITLVKGNGISSFTSNLQNADGLVSANKQQYKVRYGASFPYDADLINGYSTIVYKIDGIQVNSPIEKVSKDTTIEASASVNSYTISYNLNGGSLEDGKINPTSYTIETETFTLNNPNKTGYRFIGWSGTDLTENTLEVTINKGSLGDREYTANYEVINYTITYLDGEQEISNLSPISYNIESTDVLPTYHKDGFTFINWLVQSNDGNWTENAITAGTSLQNKYGNIVLVAQLNKQQEIPTAITGLIYNGLVQNGVNYDENGMFAKSGDVSAINAGNYQAVFTLNSGYEWLDGSKEDKVINWSISKKSLTISANNKTMVYGDEIPTFTYDIVGFVNSETVDNLNGVINYKVLSDGQEIELTTSTPVGSYVIEISGFTSNNYEIQYNNGTLTITQKASSIILSSDKATVKYGDTTTFTVKYTGDGTLNVVSGNTEYVNVSRDGEIVTVKVIKYKDDLNVNIIISSDGGGNYQEAESKTFVVTLEKRDIVVTSEGGTKSYDGLELTNKVANITNGSLADIEGVLDTIKYDFTGSQTDFGSSENLFTALIYRDNIDITNYYNTTYQYGELSVTKAILSKPNNLNVDTIGNVTFDSVIGATGYEISVDGNNFIECISGNNYNELITSNAGNITVYVRAVSSDENYESISENSEYNLNVYTLSINLSTGINSINGNGNYIAGREVQISAEISNGYDFNCWQVNSGNSPTNIYEISTVVTLIENTELTATASAKEYVITYIANSGVGENVTQKVSYNSQFTTKNSDLFTKLGYTFTNWSEDSSLVSGNFTAPNTEYTYNITDNIVLYAIWNANTYQIVYDGNDATSGNMENSNHIYDEPKNLTLNSYVKTGYSFVGWNTNINGSGTAYTDGENVVNLTSINNDTITLYAQWSVNNFIVTFNANGGDVDVLTKEVTLESTYGELPTPNRINYTFDGWYTMINGGELIKEDSVVRIASNHTLYAKWKINIEYYVDNDGIYEKQIKDNNEEYSMPETPEKQGFEFIGWTTNKNSFSYEWNNGTKICSSPVKYYAVWQRTVKLTIRYNTNGIVSSPKDQELSIVQQYNYDLSHASQNKITFVVADKITANGYEFTNWNSAFNGEGKTYDFGKKYDIIIIEDTLLNLYIQGDDVIKEIIILISSIIGLIAVIGIVASIMIIRKRNKKKNKNKRILLNR